MLAVPAKSKAIRTTWSLLKTLWTEISHPQVTSDRFMPSPCFCRPGSRNGIGSDFCAFFWSKSPWKCLAVRDRIRPSFPLKAFETASSRGRAWKYDAYPRTRPLKCSINPQLYHLYILCKMSVNCSGMQIYYCCYYYLLSLLLLLLLSDTSLKNGSFLASDKSNAFLSIHHMTNLDQAVSYSPSCALPETVVSICLSFQSQPLIIYFLLILVVTWKTEKIILNPS